MCKIDICFSSVDDLPDSQGVSSQNCEDQAVSPAVMIAAQKRKDRMKLFSVTTPETDNDEIIRRLRMGRRKTGSL